MTLQMEHVARMVDANHEALFVEASTPELVQIIGLNLLNLIGRAAKQEDPSTVDRAASLLPPATRESLAEIFREGKIVATAPTYRQRVQAEVIVDEVARLRED